MVNSLWLNLRCVAAVRFGLHGFSTLCDETLPSVGTETQRLDVTRGRANVEQSVGFFCVADLLSLIRHLLGHQFVDLGTIFRHRQHEERLVVYNDRKRIFLIFLN